MKRTDRNTPFLRDPQGRIRVRIIFAQHVSTGPEPELVGVEGWLEAGHTWNEQWQMTIPHIELDDKRRLSGWDVSWTELDATHEFTDGQEGVDFATYDLDWDPPQGIGQMYFLCVCGNRTPYEGTRYGVTPPDMEVCPGCKLPRQQGGMRATWPAGPTDLVAPNVLMNTADFREKMAKVFGPLSKDWWIEEPDGEVVIHTGLMIKPMDPYADSWGDTDSGVLEWDEITQRRERSA